MIENTYCDDPQSQLNSFFLFCCFSLVFSFHHLVIYKKSFIGSLMLIFVDFWLFSAILGFFFLKKKRKRYTKSTRIELEELKRKCVKDTSSVGSILYLVNKMCVEVY